MLAGRRQGGTTALFRSLLARSPALVSEARKYTNLAFNLVNYDRYDLLRYMLSPEQVAVDMGETVRSLHEVAHVFFFTPRKFVQLVAICRPSDERVAELRDKALDEMNIDVLDALSAVRRDDR